MKEAIIYILHEDEKVLLEFRMVNGTEELYVTGGGIEQVDHTGEKKYHETAMLRELSEELAAQVQAVMYNYVGDVTDARGVRFHIYLIFSWKGVIPSHTVELGIPEGRLVWFAIDEAIAYAGNSVRRKALQKVKKHLQSKK